MVIINIGPGVCSAVVLASIGLMHATHCLVRRAPGINLVSVMADWHQRLCVGRIEMDFRHSRSAAARWHLTW